MSKKACSARKGSLNPTSKLTEEKVLAIRNRYHEGGVSHRLLAEEFGVGKATITRILSGKNWGWLAVSEKDQVPEPQPARREEKTIDPDEWLARNKTFFCESLRARITQETCRQNHRMAMEADQSNRKSGLLGHPFYESAAKDRLYHCGGCAKGATLSGAQEPALGARGGESEPAAASR